MVTWNADTYNQFQAERSLPFFDLMNLVKHRPDLDVIDLGCGTGALTAKLAQSLTGSKVCGIDSSAEMLAGSALLQTEYLSFICRPIEEEISNGKTHDLIFSNAALQWINDYEIIIPKIIAAINPGGQLAVQMPAQQHNPANILLSHLADEEPYKAVLQDWKRMSPVLNTDRYAEIIFEHGGTEINVFEKIYPLVLENTDALINWLSGTTLIPYLQKLPANLQEDFLNAYKSLLRERFPASPLFYPFRRILMSAIF